MMDNEKQDREDSKNATTVTTFDEIFSTDTANAVYYAKAQVLNDAVQAIGVGRYQVSSLFYPPQSASYRKISGICSS
jgi:hypothetical protein